MLKISRPYYATQPQVTRWLTQKGWDWTRIAPGRILVRLRTVEAILSVKTLPPQVLFWTGEGGPELTELFEVCPSWLQSTLKERAENLIHTLGPVFFVLWDGKGSVVEAQFPVEGGRGGVAVVLHCKIDLETFRRGPIRGGTRSFPYGQRVTTCRSWAAVIDKCLATLRDSYQLETISEGEE